MRRAAKICIVDGCDRKRWSRGFCSPHYQRWRKSGDPGSAEIGAGKGDRLNWIEAHKNFSSDECLRWPFSFDPSGYGAAELWGAKIGAHRAMCFVAHGVPASRSAQAAHSCGNRWCVNPKHVRWLSASENAMEKHVHGRAAIGAKNGNSVLTNEIVGQAKKMRKNGESYAAISRYFGVSRSAISRACKGETWKHAD